MNLEAPMPAVLLGTDGTLYYFEALATSPSVVNAIAAAVGQSKAKGQWSITIPAMGEYGDDNYVSGLFNAAVKMPAECFIRTAILHLDQHTKPVHHLAVMSRSHRLILAKDNDALWLQIRDRMTCPALKEWGKQLMPEILLSGMLQPLRSHGWQDDITAWVLSDNADKTFDNLACKYVKTHGLT